MADRVFRHDLVVLRENIQSRLDDGIDIRLHPQRYSRALQAVVDKCRQMEKDNEGQPSQVGHAISLEFLNVIAKELE